MSDLPLLVEEFAPTFIGEFALYPSCVSESADTHSDCGSFSLASGEGPFYDLDNVGDMIMQELVDALQSDYHGLCHLISDSLRAEVAEVWDYVQWVETQFVDMRHRWLDMQCNKMEGLKHRLLAFEEGQQLLRADVRAHHKELRQLQEVCAAREQWQQEHQNALVGPINLSRDVNPIHCDKIRTL